MWILHTNKKNIESAFVSSAGSLLLHLLDWVKLHKADVDEKARDVLQSESPAEHRDYWDVVSADFFYTDSKCFSQIICDLALNPHLSRTLFVARAGDWLRAAGQLGQSQTDAGETGQPASCCQEHVQADGQSAQQDALLQCKRSCSCALYIHLIQPNWNWSEKQRDSHSDGLVTDVSLINVYKNTELTEGEYEFALCLSIHIFLNPCGVHAFSLVARRRWQSLTWSGDTGTRRWSAVCRTTRSPATGTWRSSARSAQSPSSSSMYTTHQMVCSITHTWQIGLSVMLKCGLIISFILLGYCAFVAMQI